MLLEDWENSLHSPALPPAFLHSILRVNGLNHCQFPVVLTCLDPRFLQTLPLSLGCYPFPFIPCPHEVPLGPRSGAVPSSILPAACTHAAGAGASKLLTLGQILSLPPFIHFYQDPAMPVKWTGLHSCCNHRGEY